MLNHNGLKFLPDCIHSLRNQTYPDHQIIVVDNASTDGSVAFLREKHTDVKILTHNENYGFGKSYNRAIREVDSRYVILLNNDVVVDKNWMSALVKCFDSHSNIFACGSRILLQDPKERINHAGGRVAIFGGGWDEKFLDPTNDQTKEPYPTSSACGAAMMMDREIFLELGGFDDDFFAYFEDADICYRAWLSGYRVMHCPQSIAYHALSGSWGRKISQRRILLGETNRLQMALKDFELTTLFKSMPALSAMRIEKMLKYLLGRGPASPHVMAQADLQIMKNLPRILRKRMQVQARRKVSDHDLQVLGVLVGLKEIIKERARLNLRRRELAVPPGYI